MIRRMIGAGRLNAQVYLELRDDPTATKQAFRVILLGSIALSMVLISGSAAGRGFGSQLPIIAVTLASFVTEWLVLSLLAFWFGRSLLRREVTFPSLLRTLGFAYVPWIFSAIVFFVGALGIWIILIWTLVAMIVALRQTLQVSLLVSAWLAILGIFFIVLTVRYFFFEGLL